MTILTRHRKQNSESAIDVKGLQRQESTEFAPQDVSYSAVFGPFLKNMTSAKSPTKLPYPAQFYYPASSLQHQTTLQMNHIDLLLNANKQETPLERFLFVVKYALSTCSLTKFPYKPFIAFIGETAHNYTLHAQEDSTDMTYFIGEQLARDPPTSCYHISNLTRGVTHEGYMEVDPKFKQAHVRARFVGKHRATLTDPAGRWREEYFIEVPDLMIRLLRLHTELGGTINITCPVTGFSAQITFKEKPIFGGGKNMVSGTIKQGAMTLYTMDGAWDDIIYIADTAGNRAEFFNRHTLPKQTLLRPPFAELPSTSGDKEWDAFIEALKARNFELAMKIKDELGKVDNERQAKHQLMSPTGFVPQYFARDATGEWRIKDASLQANMSMGVISGGSAAM